MKKIAAFTLKEPDTCIRCGQAMPVGTEATWLRGIEEKGHYHPACADKPILPALVFVKAPDPNNVLGWSWKRRNTIKQTTPKVLVDLNAPVNKSESSEEMLLKLTAALLPQLTATITAKVKAEVTNQVMERVKEALATL